MTPAALIPALEAAGVRLFLTASGEMGADVPDPAPDEVAALLDEVRRHRDEVLRLLSPGAGPAAPEQEWEVVAGLTPFERLLQFGYLVIDSSVLNQRILWVADPSRVPADLRGLPSFGWDEVERLLSLPREAGRAAIRDLLTIKATFGQDSRLTNVTSEEVDQ